MTSQRSYSGDAASDEVMFNGLTAAETDATASVRGLDTSLTHAARAEPVQGLAEAFFVVEVAHRGLTLVSLRTDEQPLPFTTGQRVHVTSEVEASARLTHAYAEGRADESDNGCAAAFAKQLNAKADAAYISYIEALRRPECLGWEAKVRAGKFGEAELKAHCLAAERLGMHRAFAAAAADVRAALSSPSPAREEAGEDVRKARRYEWLRDRLAIEDVERLQTNYLGTHDEAESMRCDEAVDSAIEQMNKESK
jgi:hypothetical protein